MRWLMVVELPGGAVHVHAGGCRNVSANLAYADAAVSIVEVESRQDVAGTPQFMACAGRLPAVPGGEAAPPDDPRTLFALAAVRFDTPQDAAAYDAAGFHVDDAVAWANAGYPPGEAVAAAVKGYFPHTVPDGPVQALPELPLPPGAYGWIVDTDHLFDAADPDGFEDEAGTMGPRLIPFRYLHVLLTDPDAGRRFRIYDGDDELYYSGRYLGPDEELYGPLDDWAEANAGATTIEYYDPDTESWARP